jgi:hypothetical protein
MSGYIFETGCDIMPICMYTYLFVQAAIIVGWFSKEYLHAHATCQFNKEMKHVLCKFACLQVK